MAKAKDKTTSVLVKHIIEGIKKKKGKEIVSINLSGLQNAVCRYFIIASGESKTQVNAIAESVEENVWKHTAEYPHHTEGSVNAQWVLLDYILVVVHIFQREYRDFYQLESLWADGVIRRLPDEN